jgi:hypothetical protein
MQGREMLIYEQLLSSPEEIYFILSRVGVTIDGVWIGEQIYYHLQVVTPNNYYTIADLHTTNHSQMSCLNLRGNSSPQWLFMCSVITRCFLVTNLNNGDPSASVALWLTLHSRPLSYQLLVVPIVFKVIPRQGPRGNYQWTYATLVLLLLARISDVA